ncbi:MAG: GTP-binding signal recognition particle G-domain protein, partial [Conexibacter sp.]|nr:GTP-binding signal recognition particle G-domain protein [Conexibacter sp.]
AARAAPAPSAPAPAATASAAPAPERKRATSAGGAKPAKPVTAVAKPKPKPKPKRATTTTAKAGEVRATPAPAPTPRKAAAPKPATAEARETAPAVGPQITQALELAAVLAASVRDEPAPAAAPAAVEASPTPDVLQALAAPAPVAAERAPAEPVASKPAAASARGGRPAGVPSTPRGSRRGVFGTRRKGQQPKRPPVVDAVAAGAVATALVGRGLSAPVAAALLAEVTDHLLPFTDGADLRAAARSALARRIPVPGPPPVGGRSVAFVGAAGSGKTRCAAGLAAAYAAASSLPVAALTLASPDRGAQLAALLAGHGVDVEPHATPDSAAKRIEALRGEALVVLDTPGVSPGDAAAIAELAALLGSLALDETHLVVPATLSAVAAQELVERLAPLRPDGVAMTHADATGHVGAVVELACATRLPLAYVNDGLALPGALRPADPTLIAERMLP